MKNEPIAVRKATPLDIHMVEQGYFEHFAYESTHKAWTIFRKDVYPTKQSAMKAQRNDSLYVAFLNGKFAGSMVVNDCQPDEYGRIAWPSDCKEALVLHLIMVRPSLSGRGIGTRLVEHAFSLARERGFAVLRLDTGGQNLPALALYKKLGFTLAARGGMDVGGVLTHDNHCFLEKAVQSP